MATVMATMAMTTRMSMGIITTAMGITATTIMLPRTSAARSQSARR